MKAYTEGLKYADKLITRAIEERDSKGYRENLGYDSIHELEDYLQTLDLTYSEGAGLVQYFNNACDGI